MKKILILSMLHLALITPIFGNKEGGNGGDVVVCDNDKVTMLDVYEAKDSEYFFGIGDKNDDYRSMVNIALNRVKGVSPNEYLVLDRIAQELMSSIDQFYADVSANPEVLKEKYTYYDHAVFTTQPLVDVPDSKHLTMDPGCSVQQLVLQFAENNGKFGSYGSITRKPYSKRFLINKELFLKLDSVSVASMVIHEAAYYKHINRGNSIAARSFNALITSSKWDLMDLKEIYSVMGDLGYKKSSFVEYLLRSGLGEMIKIDHENYVIKSSKIAASFNRKDSYMDVAEAFDANGVFLKDTDYRAFTFSSKKEPITVDIKYIDGVVSFERVSIPKNAKIRIMYSRTESRSFTSLLKDFEVVAPSLSSYITGFEMQVDFDFVSKINLFDPMSYFNGSVGNCVYRYEMGFVNDKERIKNLRTGKSIKFTGSISTAAHEALSSGFCD